MAKEIQDNSTLGFDEIEELEQIAQGSIPNRNELVHMHSDMLNRTVTVSRDQVYKYASVMSNNTLIADLLGISKETLASNFKRELKMGRAFARQKLFVRFYHLALYGNNPADRLFALKNWGNMSDNGLKEELDEIEEGAEFQIRRPKKPVETLNDQEIRAKVYEKWEKAEELSAPEGENETN